MKSRTKPVWVLTSLVCVGLICGCASIVSKSQYPVSITSKPSGARISIVDETGKTVMAGVTPTTVTLSTKAGYFKGKDYSITFTKPGYATYRAEIKRGLDGWYVCGNLVFGGLIGYLVVDPITGAMWKLPKEVTATLSPQLSIIQGSDDMHIISLEQVPDYLRKHMVRVD